ncbi:MAG: DsbA family protein [Xanthobacteraceae bacterium]|jgi:protein-disulfide isomerase
MRDNSSGSRKAAAFFAFLGAAAVAFVTLSTAAVAQQADGDILSRASVLRDPEIPSLGNPDGDLTIVEFFDYQCPYCKKVAPELAQVAKDDGKVRIVLKDWPIFGDVSKDAAKLVLAAKYQDKYAQAHDAVIGAKTKLTGSSVRELLAKAGVDVAKATADLQTNQKAIDDLLARNNAQAEAFGFPATPAFIVGTFRVPGMLTKAGFKAVIADARAAAPKP